MTGPPGQILGSLVEEYAFSASGSARVVNVLVRILADRGAPVKLGDTRGSWRSVWRGTGTNPAAPRC